MREFGVDTVLKCILAWLQGIFAILVEHLLLRLADGPLNGIEYDLEHLDVQLEKRRTCRILAVLQIVVDQSGKRDLLQGFPVPVLLQRSPEQAAKARRHIACLS